MHLLHIIRTENMHLLHIIRAENMLKRKIERKLLAWKENKDKNCLLVKGARQVGKTYSINKFENIIADIFTKIGKKLYYFEYLLFYISTFLSPFFKM